MPQASGASKHYWRKWLANALLDQQPPVQNTWYTILNTTEDAEIYYVIVRQNNGDVAAKDLEIRVTADGVVRTSAFAGCGNDAFKYVYTISWAGDFTVDDFHKNFGGYSSIKAQSIKIEVRITSALGANQRLRGIVVYGQDLET